MSFREATSITRIDDFRYKTTVPDGWSQGRGAFGGLVLATLLRTMQDFESEEDRTPRTISGELTGPVLVGDAEIEVSVLRRGNNLTALDARLWQGDEVKARASAILARTRPVEVAPVGPERPTIADWQECDIIPLEAPLGPVFSQHYEYRPVAPFPYSGSDEYAARGWIREKSAPETYDYPAIVGYLDSFWPTVLATMTTPRPTATISFTGEFFADPAELDPAIPFHFEGRGVAKRGGYLTEFRELWHDEQLVALNQQTFAIIK